MGEETVFTLAGGELVQRGARSGERRWPLARLKRAEVRRLYAGPTPTDYVLALVFDGGRTALVSRSYAGLGAARDQTAEFAAFSRRLLDLAADAAPHASYLRGPSRFAGTLNWALMLLGSGAVATILFAAMSGAFFALGLDLGARMLFATLLLGCAWPWVADERRRAFNPAALSSDVLPQL